MIRCCALFILLCSLLCFIHYSLGQSPLTVFPLFTLISPSINISIHFFTHDTHLKQLEKTLRRWKEKRQAWLTEEQYRKCLAELAPPPTRPPPSAGPIRTHPGDTRTLSTTDPESIPRKTLARVTATPASVIKPEPGQGGKQRPQVFLYRNRAGKDLSNGLRVIEVDVSDYNE